MPLTRIDSAFLDLDAIGGIDFDVQNSVPTLKVDAVNHRVGIGNNSPTEKLDVVGNVNISSGSNYLVNGSQISTANIAENSSYQYFTNARAISAVQGSALNMGNNNITTTGKILFANMYSAEGDLPSASTYHGMFAHVHGTEKAYFAHAGSWVKLLDENGGSTGSLSIDGNVSSTTQFSGFDALRIHNANGSAFGITADMYFTVGTATTNRGAAIGVEYATTTGNDLYFATNPGAITNSDTLEERLRITSAGNVGIGTDAPGQLVHINKASGTTLFKASTQANSTIGFEIEKTGATTQSWRIVDGQTVNGALEFYDVTNSATRMIVRNGNIGIGESNPSRKLHINAGATDTAMLIESTDADVQINFKDGDSTSGVSIGCDNQDFYVRTGLTTERFRIKSDGLVDVSGGIQISENVTPTTGAGLELFREGGGAGQIQAYDRSNTTWLPFIVKGSTQSFHASGSERLSISSTGVKQIKNGNLNIYQTYIDFSGDQSSVPQTAVALYRPADGTFAISTQNTERLRISSTGNVGIGTGTTNPAQKLHVIGSLLLETTSATGNAWTYYKNADRTYLVGVRGSSDDALSFYDLTADVERMRITTGGLVKINTPSMVAGTNAASALLQIKSVGQYDGLVLGNTYAQGAIGTNSQGALIYTSNAAPANLGGGDVAIQQWYSGSSGGGGPSLLMNLTTGGNLGLGCTPGNSAGYKTLQLGDGSTSAGQIWIKNSSNSNYYNWFDGTGVNFYAQSASPLIFYTSQSEKLRIRESTSTTFPNNPYVLNVTGHSAYNSADHMAGSGLAFIGEYNSSNSQTTFALISGVKENTTDGHYGGSLIFGVRTDNTGAVNQEKVRISSTGNMGIGHKLPSAGLHIKKQGRNFGLHYFYDGYSSDDGLGGDANSSVGSQAGERTHSLILESTSTAGEDVGASIGFRAKSSSGSTLGDVTFGAIVGAKENAIVTDDNGYTTQSKGYLAFYTSNSYHFNPHYGTLNNERMRISSDGDVGIGLTNPVHKLQVAGGIRGDYIETDAHAVWTQSVETGTGGESGGVILKTNPDLTSSNMSGAFLYRVRAVVKGTGTDTGATWLVYYNEAAAQYVVRFVSRSGDTSNHPRLRIANTTQMQLYTTHNSNYPVRVITERYYTEEPDSTLHAMGSDYHWQRSGSNISYTDGNINTNVLTPNPLNLTSANGWIRSGYGAISNSTVLSLNNLLIGQNMRGYLSGIDGGSSTNNNFYHTTTHGGMGYNGIEFCYNGVMKFFAGTGGTTANTTFTPGVRFQIQNTMANFMDGTPLSQGDSVAFHNGMRSYSNRGYVAGNGTVSCTLNVANSQTTYLVMAGFNHYGLLGYGATYMAFTATGPSGPTSNVINNNPTSLGGGWSISQGGQAQLVVSKSAGTYNGGGYWFVHIMAAS